jgi:signal transduction histidine kinase
MRQPRRWPTIAILAAVQAAWIVIVVVWVIWYVKYRQIRMEPFGMWDVVIVTEVSVLFTLILGGIYVLFILYQRQLSLMRTQMYIVQSVTHAFKTPIATLQLYLETMTARNLPEKTKAELIDGMLVVNARLKSLVYNFLESARLSSERRHYQFGVVSLQHLVSSCIERHRVFLRGVDINVHAGDEDVAVQVDPEAFDLVFQNLVENAVHYSKGAARVDIDIRKDERFAYLTFSDAGIGIPRERHRDIFKMFKRLPEAVSMWGSGTGMGLYVVRGIVEAHGGTIRVESRDTGEGSAFSIRLPLVRT